MSNQYTIQLRTADNNFITTLDNTKVMGSFSFSRTIDNGYGDIRIIYNVPRTDTTIREYRIIKVYQWWSIIYRGYISDIDYIASSNGEITEFKVIGLQALLNNSNYEGGGSGVVNKNDDPVNIINDILGQHNTNVWWTMFDWSWLTPYWSNIHMEFDNMNALASIKSVAEQVGYIVDFMPDGTIRFFEPNTEVIHHPLVYWLHVTEIRKKRKTSDMVNKVTLKYNWSIATGDNTDSQGKYWIIRKVFSDDRIKNTGTANIRVQTELRKWAEPILQMQCMIQNNYTAEINIGDTVAIKNKKSETYWLTWNDAWDLWLDWEDFEPLGTYESTRDQTLPSYPYIAKIDYLDTHRVITLWDYDSLSKSLTKL